MCGIFGTTLKKDFRKALSLLNHRGPDDTGLFQNDKITLAHKRLAIIDLSERGHQPMFNDRGNLSLIYNGEIYNYQDLKKGLMAEGVSFKSESDTEVLLKGFEKYGNTFFSKLEGMWAAALYDAETNRLTLSCDHFGIKPIFYANKGKDIIFASEVKALVSQLEKVTPNTDSYFLFYNFGYFPGGETSFKEIKKLLPGEIIAFDLNAGTNKKLFAELSNNKTQKNTQEYIEDEEEAVKIIDESLTASVEKHFLADVPVSLLLSGGNDSSLLAALSKKLGKDPICFNVAISGSGDGDYAERVVRELGLNLEKEVVTENSFKEQYKKVFDILDQPTGDVSFIPTSLVYSSIEGKSKVVLSGEGGDELFGGYLRHTNFASFQNMDFKNSFRYPYFTSDFGLKYVNPIFRRTRFQKSLGSAYLNLSKTFDFPIKQKETISFMQEFYKSHPYKDYIQPNLFFDLFMYLPYNLMYKGDMSSMAYSIESRVPFLDKAFFNAVSRVSPELRLSPNFTSKKIMKKVMEKYLPKELIYRKKSGFGVSLQKFGEDLVLADLKAALKYHKDNKEALGIVSSGLEEIVDTSKAEIILKKYPRFAYSLITNHKVIRAF